MVLSDKTIKEYLKKGDLSIDPISEDAIQPASVDLRLGDSFRIFQYSTEVVVDFRSDRKPNTKKRKLLEGEIFVLHPGEFVLGTTYEKICIPSDIVGSLEGKSTLGRVGIVVHATAGHINPGFKGNLTLELSNVGKLPVILYSKMAICQIAFSFLSTEAEHPYGTKDLGSKYQGQKGATESR